MKRILAATAALAIAGGALADHTTTIVDNMAGVFIDISGTGTALGLTDDGEANIVTTIGNALLAAGNVRIGNNGAAGWGITTGDLGFTNGAIGTAGLFGGTVQALAPFWDDLDEETGNVYWQEVGGQLIIQWHQRPHFPGAPDSNHVTFQIQVNGNGNGSTIPYAQYLYLDTIFGDANDNGAGATVGYQSAAGNHVTWSFNQGVITNGLVLSIVDIPAPGALALLGAAGLVARRRRRA